MCRARGWSGPRWPTWATTGWTPGHGVVGLPLAVANAQPEILDMAAWVSTRPGGHGAVREAISFIWMPGATWTPMGPVAVA